ncbi:MAG: translocation/assembly module TamB domain-containing protein [Xanthomonadales bacterium]|jgi:translocation and assembly module TamB|nr:translocation/assembly module TamB domain-containing protein [Xanthomonadales bacterium]
MRRLLIIAVSVLLIAALGVAAGWQWLHSEGGNRWLVERAIEASDGALTVDGLRGRFDESLTARSLAWDQDGLRVDLEDVALRGAVSAWPPGVTLVSARVGALQVTLDPAAPDAGEPADWPAILDGLALPVPVSIAQWNVGPVELLDGEGGRDRLLDAAEGSLRWFDALVLPSFAWEAPQHAGRGSLQLELQAPYRHVLELEAEAPALERTPGLSLSLVGDEAETRLEAAATGRDRLDAAGVVLQPLERPELRLDIETAHVGLTSGVALTDLLLSLDGPPGHLAVNAEGILETGESPPAPWTLEGRLAPSSFTVEALEIEAGDRRFIAEGVASLLPGRIHVDPLALRSLDGETRLGGDLHFELDTEQVEADLEWQGLSWPLEGGEAAWRSPRGRLAARGTPSSWTGSARVDVLAPNLPESGSFDIEADGGLERGRFRLTGSGSLLERIEGEGILTWDPALRLEWGGSVSGLDASPFIDGWPSAIDAQLRYLLDGRSQQFDIASLGGTLRGEPLSGAGRLETSDGRWVFEDIRVGIGEARFDIGGAWPEGRLTVESSVPPRSAPARWLGFEANGFLTFDGSVEPPGLEARLEGRGPELEGLTLGAWTLEGDSAVEGLAFNVELPATGNALAGRVSGTLRLAGQGLDVALNLQQGEQALILALDSEPVAWRADMTPRDLDLGGRLTMLEALQGEEVLFRLDRPTPFRVAQGRFSLSEACGRVVGGGSACLEGAVDTDGELSLDATLEALPLAPLAARLGLAIVPDQSVDGEFSFRRTPGALPSGLLVLDLSAGALRDPEQPERTLETGPARVNFVLDEGQIRSGVFELPLPGVGSIEGSLDAANVRLDGSGSVRGRARVQITDLSSVGVLLPDLERLSGGMSTELDLTGSVGEPILDGLVRFEDVAFSVPYLGLEVTDLNGEGYARGQGEAALQATFRVGEGSGRLLGDVDLTPGSGLPFIFRIEGENLRLVETPDIELDANPAMDLSWSDGAWTIDGSLEVPRLRLTPRSTLVGQVSESEDVVIVAGEPPVSPPPPIYATNRFFGQLELVLGDDITLETEDAQARVGGGLTLSWSGPPEPVAEGALTVTGEIEIFGPVLRISDGNLRFPGVPVSNPVLDLRAERDVFGNTQIRAAGVAVSGTARRPSIEAYTRPFTTRDRAWALLITGQDFDQGQSITALEVGAYIAPRIYVSYGVSLFDDENVASVRYDFSRGFGVKATSGVRQTGVDISYTIEND